MNMLIIFEKIIANTLFCSIPEEVFPMAVLLILLRKFTIFELNKLENKVIFKKHELLKFIIPVSLSALVSNVFRYTGLNVDLMSLFSILTMCVFTIILYKIRKIIEIIKAIVFTFLSAILLLLIELTYIPVLEHAVHKTLEEVNNDIPLNFLFGLPGRVICFSILAIIIIKRAAFFEIKLISSIRKNKWTFIILSFLVIVNFIFLFAAWKIIAYNNLFVHSSLIKQLIINVSVIVFPILNMLGTFGIIYSIENGRTFTLILKKKRLVTLTDAAILFYKDGQFDKMEKALQEIRCGVEKITEIA